MEEFRPLELWRFLDKAISGLELKNAGYTNCTICSVGSPSRGYVCEIEKSGRLTRLTVIQAPRAFPRTAEEVEGGFIDYSNTSTYIVGGLLIP